MKVDSKLYFEVGEKVVVTGDEYSMSNNRVTWPNKNDFTITTITKVNDDGSVEVEGGHVYRQSYSKEFDSIRYHDYFRVKKAPYFTKFNSKRYIKSYSGYYEVCDSTCFCDVTYLFKLTEEFENKMLEIQHKYNEAEKERAEAKREREEKEARTQPHLDEFNDFMKPLEDELYAKKCAAWKEFVCAHCKHNFGGKCSKWKDENNSYQDIKTMEVSSCSAFEGR